MIYICSFAVDHVMRSILNDAHPHRMLCDVCYLYNEYAFARFRPRLIVRCIQSIDVGFYGVNILKQPVERNIASRYQLALSRVMSHWTNFRIADRHDFIERSRAITIPGFYVKWTILLCFCFMLYVVIFRIRCYVIDSNRFANYCYHFVSS